MKGSLQEGHSGKEAITQKKPTKETKKTQRPLPNTEKAPSGDKPGSFTIK